MLDVQALVKPWLDSESGDEVTASLAVLGGSMLLVGTRSGSLMVLRLGTGPSSHDGRRSLVFSQRLHCGAVYDIALSASQLVATAGHDAVVGLIPLADLVSSPCWLPCGDTGAAPEKVGDKAAQVRRLSGHTLPVLSVAFFSDGHTLATVSVHGELVVFDAVTGETQWRLHCGFPARTLALSTDETCCFVGGAMLARVDLFHAGRSATDGSGAAGLYRASAASSTDHDCPQPWLRLCCWHDLTADGEASGAWEARVFVAAAGCVIRKLHVSPMDGSLTALFVQKDRCGGAEVPAALARWSFSSLHPFLADSITPLAEPVHGAKSADASSLPRPLNDFGTADQTLRECGEMIALRARGVASEGLASRGNLPPGPLPWSSVAAAVRAARHRGGDVGATNAEAAAAEGQPVSKAQRLEGARIRHHMLQLECNELARRLREALAE